jgi:hypothetical protein
MNKLKKRRTTHTFVRMYFIFNIFNQIGKKGLSDQNPKNEVGSPIIDSKQKLQYK